MPEMARFAFHRMSRMLSAARIAAKATQFLRQPHRVPRQLVQPASETRGASQRRVATSAMASMSTEDRYLFDLNGYVIVPQVRPPVVYSLASTSCSFLHFLTTYSDLTIIFFLKQLLYY